MNSHYFCSKFDKVPNIWRFETIEKLSQVICSRENKSKIKFGWQDEYQNMPYEIVEPIDIERGYRLSISELDVPYNKKRFFTRLEDGWDIIR